MQHRLARPIIELLVGDPGLGPRSTAALHVGLLADRPPLAPQVDRLFATVRDLPPAPALTDATYAASSTVPGDLPGYYHRFGSVLVDRSQRSAPHIELLYLLGQVWGHARREERERLFVRWLDLLHGTRAAPGTFITRDDLRGWQRNQLTAHDSADPSPDALQGMLAEESPQQAYAILAQFLGFNTRMDELSRSLRVLARSLVLRRQDPAGDLLTGVAAAACCERMAPEAPPDLLITMLSLLALAVWFGHHDHGERRQPAGATRADADLADAILAGDIVASQARARLCCADHERFWSAVGSAAAALVAGGDLLRGLRALAVLHLVTGTEVPTPEAAAMTCGELAAAVRPPG